MKFRIVNKDSAQWLTKKTWKSRGNPPMPDEVESEPVDSFSSDEDRKNASELRKKYGWQGKPYGIEKDHV